MINEYKSFLADKSDYWRKAKQYEYQDIDRIVLALENISHFTTRNSMSLRILGLINNLGNNELELTDAGKRLLVSKDKQAVIDEQLLKVYLDSPINTGVSIPVFPLQIIYALFEHLDLITFKEYMFFICWTDDNSQTNTVKRLILDYRGSTDTTRSKIQEVFEAKLVERGTKDMADNIVRLYNMFSLSSFITTEGSRLDRVLLRNSSPDLYKKLSTIIRDFKFEDYKTFDFQYQNIIDFSSEHQEITNSLQNLTKQERHILTQSLREVSELPSLESIKPTLVRPTITKPKEGGRDAMRVSTEKKYKADYIAKENTNRIVGLFAERIVVKAEYDALVSLGRLDLASRINHISLEDDSAGYDISSFVAETNTEKHIEVKAVSGYPSTFRFFISANELNKAKSDPNYSIYIVFDYRTDNPKIWEMPNIFKTPDPKVDISPTKFVVTVMIDR